jgi:PAS domain S-box-containing protein
MIPGSLVGVAAMLLALALWVLAARPRHPINRWFAAYTVGISCWTLSIGMLHSGIAPELWSRLAFMSASFIPCSFLVFTTVYPSPSPWPSRTVLRGVLLIAAAFAVLSITSPLIIHDAVVTTVGFTRKSGGLYPFFVVYFLAACLTAFAVFLTKWRRERGQARAQLQYLAIGLIFSFIGGITTNLLFPFFMGRTAYIWLGPYFTLPLVIFASHAIIRHRLMNVRLIVRRGFVYLIAVIIAGVVFGSFVALWTHLLADHRREIPLGLEVAVALAIALAFQPLRRRLQSGLDRYFYREPYNYQRIVREASKTITSTLDLASLLTYLCQVTGRTLRSDLVAVFTRDAGDQSFRLAAMDQIGNTDNRPDATPVLSAGPLPSFLASSRRPLLKDDLGRTISGAEAESAVTHLAQLGGEIALPMLSEDQLLGFLLVGPKLSGDALFNEDVELLSTLSSQAAIAVRNAQLYRQVVLANEYIENILSTMDSGVITVDSLGRVALVNATAERLTGLSKELLTSMTVEQLPRALASTLSAALSDGHSRSQVETSLPGDREVPIPIMCSTSALRDDRSTILGALIVFSDLTEVKALESEKRRAERLAAFSTLVSGIAHEIKNPLVAIRTFAELLPERFTETDFREDFSKVVITEIDRIDDLVGRLRGLAVPSLQHPVAIDIKEPITETLALLRGKLEQTQTVVRTEFSAGPTLVSVDSAQLKQLFLNLFLNSIEAMDTRGELTISVTGKQTQTGSWVIVEISDTGPGIPDSIRGSIFNPFFTTKPRGSGLGLAICRGIMDAHHGIIRAESGARHSGAKITLEFPTATATSDLAQEPVIRV